MKTRRVTDRRSNKASTSLLFANEGTGTNLMQSNCKLKEMSAKHKLTPIHLLRNAFNTVVAHKISLLQTFNGKVSKVHITVAISPQCHLSFRCKLLYFVDFRETGSVFLLLLSCSRPRRLLDWLLDFIHTSLDMSGIAWNLASLGFRCVGGEYQPGLRAEKLRISSFYRAELKSRGKGRWVES